MMGYNNLMHQSKLQFLATQNFKLSKSLSHKDSLLSLDKSSDVAQKSLIFQLEEENHSLRDQVQGLQCEMLLEKQARQIQTNILQDEINSLNKDILQIKTHIHKLQALIKSLQIQKNYHSSSAFSWFTNDIPPDPLHKLHDPILTFEIMSEVLMCLKNQERFQQFYSFEKQSVQPLIEDQIEMKICQQENKQSNKILYQANDLEESNIQFRRWYDEESTLYFLNKKDRNEQLYLKLESAKAMQYELFNPKQIANVLNKFCDVKLLKKSYVNLLIEYELGQRTIRMYQKYIEELESVNQLLIQSSLGNDPIKKKLKNDDYQD